MASPRTSVCEASNYPWEKGGTPRDTADRPKSNSIPLIWGVRAPLARGWEKIPSRHNHNNVQDAFYVRQGRIRIFLRDPREEVRLGPGETFSVAPKRPHLVVNGGEVSATFLVLQGLGEYDFVPLT